MENIKYLLEKDERILGQWIEPENPLALNNKFIKYSTIMIGILLLFAFLLSLLELYDLIFIFLLSPLIILLAFIVIMLLSNRKIVNLLNDLNYTPKNYEKIVVITNRRFIAKRLENIKKNLDYYKHIKLEGDIELFDIKTIDCMEIIPKRTKFPWIFDYFFSFLHYGASKRSSAISYVNLKLTQEEFEKFLKVLEKLIKFEIQDTLGVIQTYYRTKEIKRFQDGELADIQHLGRIGGAKSFMKHMKERK